MLRNENTQVKLYGFDGRGHGCDVVEGIALPAVASASGRVPLCTHEAKAR